jgi:hypothetical protein
MLKCCKKQAQGAGINNAEIDMIGGAAVFLSESRSPGGREGGKCDKWSRSTQNVRAMEYITALQRTAVFPQLSVTAFVGYCHDWPYTLIVPISAFQFRSISNTNVTTVRI